MLDTTQLTTESTKTEIPGRCKAILDGIDQTVLEAFANTKEYLKLDFLHSQINMLEIELNHCNTKSSRQKLEDKKWVRENRLAIALEEYLVDQPELVYAVCREKRGKKVKWIAKVWVGKHTLALVETSCSHIKSLLTDLVYKKLLTAKNKLGFVVLKKYDRADDLNKTHFRRVRMVNASTFEVMDVNGMTVFVSAAWARDNIENDALNEAINHPQKWSGPMGVGSGGAAMSTKHHNIEHALIECGTNMGTNMCTKLPSNPKVATGSPVTMPLVMFRNTVGNQCLGLAMACGLAYLGYTAEAERVAGGYKLGKIRHNSCQSSDFRNWVLVVMNKSNIKVRWRNAKYLYHGNQRRRKFGNGLNIEARLPHPIVATIGATQDGKPVNVNHCVCFVNGYVFDPNMEHAMLITKENMDTICSNIIHGARYEGIKWSRMLYFPNEKGTHSKKHN